jgi:hypothetical protein
MQRDIRTGFDFEAVKARDYSSASLYLRAEWAHLRETLPEYSFGRHELLPVKNPDGFGLYVARYVGRTFHTRRDDKGARLVRFSQGFHRVVCGPFSKVDLIRKRAVKRLPVVAEILGYRDVFTMTEDIGKAWRYKLARILHCKDNLFLTMMCGVKHDLQYAGGGLFALQEQFKKLDAGRPDWAFAAELWDPTIMSEVGRVVARAEL